MCKTKRLTTDFREMRSELNQASDVNKWGVICKDSKLDHYHDQRSRISLNKTIKGIDGKVAALHEFTVVNYGRNFDEFFESTIKGKSISSKLSNVW